MPKKTKKKETEGFGEDNLVEKEEEEKLDLGDEPIDPIELGDDEDDDPDDLAERGLHIIDGDENPLDLTDDDLGNEGVEDEEDEEDFDDEDWGDEKDNW
jgi:hypothetical protein